MKLSLFINGCEQLRIEDGKYYITNSYEVFSQVDKELFKRELEKYDWALNSWDKEIREEYKALVEAVKN